MKRVSVRAATPEAYDLIHRGALAFSRMESNGMRVDLKYLDRAARDVDALLAESAEHLQSGRVWRLWTKRYGRDAKLTNKHQLAKILYTDLDFECPAYTANRTEKTDESTLEQIPLPWLREYVAYCKLEKLRSTGLANIKAEVCGEFIHAFFNLHLVISYRSSCDTPNLQNIPIRNPVIGEIIRRCFIPRKGRRLVEIDFKGAEVRVAVCYTKDPTLMDDVINPERDMHRDMAMEIYKLKRSQVAKEIRNTAKNKFVFPEFYGSYYPQVSIDLWEDISRYNLKVGEKSLKQHLAEKGITSLGACNPKHDPVPGTLEHHVQQVEKRFWHKRYKVYTDWKNQWWESYLKSGGFLTHTGFYIEGVLRKNQVLNLPIQGSAFHCNLWTIIQLDDWLQRKRMRTVLISQIHDSILADVPDDEFDCYVQKVKWLVEVGVRRAYPWLIIPLSVEASATERNQSWYTKKEIAL